MSDKTTIKVITEKRSDAIHVYTEALVKNLPKEKANIETIVLNNKPFKNPFLNFVFEIVNTVKLLFLIHRDEIVLFTDPLSFNVLASLFLKNKKYILFFHYEKDPFYYKYLPFISYKKILGIFDGIICSSEFSVSQLSQLNVDTKRYRVIYGGIDHNLFKPSSVGLYPFEYILSIGSEEPRKNMENILKAFQILKKDFPHLKLLKVGNANPKNRTQTKSYVNKYQLSDSVIFTNFIGEEQLPQIYSGAKLLLFPSLLEGFGLPVVEAMACACPVITSNRSPMTELIGSSQIAVDPLDATQIAQECKGILLDSNYRNETIKNGLVRAQKFDSKKTAEEVFEFVTSSQ